MLNFTYSIPTNIFFGKGQIKVLGKEFAKLKASKVLICFGSDRIKKNGIFDDIANQLKQNNIKYNELSGILPNPRITSVREGVSICKTNNIDLVLAVGGGSVIDCAKAIAAARFYDGDPWDFFTRKARIEKTLPIACVLTLAATGSEMNGNSVISNAETKQKLHIGSPLLNPVFSVLDPTYTYSVPQYQTAAGVVDIISHVLEQYFCSTKESFIQDRLAEAILKTCIEFGNVAINQPDNYEARANLLWAGSLALNNLLSFGKRGEWAVHMIEHELSAVYDITHGAGLAVLFPHWMEYVFEQNIDRLYTLGRNVFNINSDDKNYTARHAIECTRELFKSLGMPSKLSDTGIEKNSLDEMAQKAVAFGKLGNTRKLDKNDVLQILNAAF